MTDITATISQTIVSATVTNTSVSATASESPITATLSSGDVNATLSATEEVATLLSGGTITATVTSSPITATVSSGISNHSALTELDYVSAGHTGFQATLTPDVDYLIPSTIASTYPNVTLGTPSGLSLVSQALSLGLASSGVTGALSGTDWDTFSAKTAGSGTIGQVSQWTAAKTLGDAALIAPATNILTLTNAAASTLALNITAAKTLTLTAADNYTLTVPETMIAAGRNVANVFTAAQTINVSSATALTVWSPSQATTPDFQVKTTNGSSEVIVGRLSGTGFDNTNFSVRNRLGTKFIDANLVSNYLALGVTGGEVLRIGSSKNIGIGVAPSTPRLYVKGDSNQGMWIETSSASSSGGGAGFVAFTNDGAAMGSGHRLGYNLFGGYDGATVRNSAGINAYADSLWSSGVFPSYLTFDTTDGGSRVERVRIHSDGGMMITGGADRVQQITKANATQTAALVQHKINTTVHNEFFVPHASNLYTTVFNKQGSPLLDFKVSTDTADAIWVDASAELLSLGVNTQIINNKELRFFDDGANYVGFEAPALSADQIWVLPDADGADGDVMFTDGAGNLKWGANASTRAFTFSSKLGSTGTTYSAGHYRFASSDNDFNPGINFGTANGAYGDHIFLIAAAGASGGTDTVVRLNGTTIDDLGNRTAGVNVDLTLDDAGSAGAYYETSEKWVGLVTITKLSGPDLLCNYGGAKYWDDNNEDFKVEGVDVTWLGGANDASANLILRHHKATGWTYNAGAEPTPPTAIAEMNTDYVTEVNVINGEEGAWKRTNLSINVMGSVSEGLIIEIVTSANRSFEIGNFLTRVVPQ